MVEIKKVKQITENLSKFSYYENADESKYITITEWANGEGIDIDINGQLHSLSYDILDGINYLVQVLRYEK